MGSQWRTGSSGAIGLDYSALPVVMDLLEIPAKKRPELFQSLQIIEFAALGEMARAREKKR